MTRFRRHAAVAAGIVSAVGLIAAAPAGAACVSTTSQGGAFTGKLLVGPPGKTFATYIRTKVTNVNVLGWWGSVTVNNQVSETFWLPPWGSHTVIGPTIIGQQYVYFRVDVDPLSDATQLGLQVCA